jgi:hypothetical protein
MIAFCWFLGKAGAFGHTMHNVYLVMVFSIPNIALEMEIKPFNLKIMPTLGNHCGFTICQQQKV